MAEFESDAAAAAAVLDRCDTLKAWYDTEIGFVEPRRTFAEDNPYCRKELSAAPAVHKRASMLSSGLMPKPQTWSFTIF
jgi:hypothetical protein